MEIELVPERFAPLTRYFDFDAFQKTETTQELPESFFDDYLKDSPSAFESLPKSLRDQLSEGLDLGNLLAEPNSSLPKSAGRVLSAHPSIAEPASGRQPAPIGSLVRPSGIEVVPQSKTVPSEGFFQSQQGLHLPKRAAWDVLDARWNALDLEVRRSVVRWEHLSPVKKALIAIDYANCSKLKAKDSLTGDERKLFEKLYWSRDGESIEFRHKEDVIVKSPEEFYRDVRYFARLAGPLVEIKILDNPKAPIKGVTFHYHTSVAGKAIDQVGMALNDLELVKFVARGDITDLTGKGRFIYSRDAQARGLVRVVSGERFESRSHQDSLQEELAFRVRLVGMDPKSAVKAVYAEVSRFLTDDVVNAILHYKPAYMLGMLDHVSVPGLRERLRDDARVASEFPWDLSIAEDRAVLAGHLRDGFEIPSQVFDEIFESRPALAYREFPGLIERLEPAQPVVVSEPEAKPVYKVTHRVILSTIDKINRRIALKPYEREFLIHTVMKSNKALCVLLQEEPLDRLLAFLEQDPRVFAHVLDAALTEPSKPVLDRLATRLSWRAHVLQSLVRGRQWVALEQFPWDLKEPAELVEFKNYLNDAPKGSRAKALSRVFARHPELAYREFPNLISQIEPAAAEVFTEPGSLHSVRKVRHPVILSAFSKLRNRKALKPYEKEFLLHSLRTSDHVLALVKEGPLLNPLMTFLEREDPQAFTRVIEAAFDSLRSDNPLRSLLDANTKLRTRVLQSMVASNQLKALEQFPWDFSKPAEAAIIRNFFLSGSTESSRATGYYSQKGLAQYKLEHLSKYDPDLLRSAFPDLAGQFDLSPFPRIVQVTEYREPSYWVFDGKNADVFHRIDQGAHFSDLEPGERELLRQLFELPLKQEKSRQDDFFSYMLRQQGEFQDLAIERLSRLRAGDSQDLLQRLKRGYVPEASNRLKAIHYPGCDLESVVRTLGG